MLKTKGRDLPVLGYHADGDHWLWPEEVLCLLEDSLLALDHTANNSPLSVQEAYLLILGSTKPLVT